MTNQNTEPSSIPLPIQQAWDSLNITLLGAPAGPLAEFVPYLRQDVQPVRRALSSLSGKEVFISDDHAPGTKFVTNDEAQTLAQGKELHGASKPVPFNVNDIKDIDSLQRALGEQLTYAGSIALGNCAQVERSNRVFDSQTIFESQEVFYSKKIAYSNIIKYSECVFGSESVGWYTKFTLRGFETYDSSRVLESIIAYRSSDLFYTANCDQCQDCLFSFNQRSARKLIGNRPMPPDEFKSLKTKLLSEMKEELKSKKKLPSIVELIAQGEMPNA